jgi:hypothetical protein
MKTYFTKFPVEWYLKQKKYQKDKQTIRDLDTIENLKNELLRKRKTNYEFVKIYGEEQVIKAIISDSNNRLLLFVRKKIPQQDKYLIFLINDDEILEIPDISKSISFDKVMKEIFNKLKEATPKTIDDIKNIFNNIFLK